MKKIFTVLIILMTLTLVGCATSDVEIENNDYPMEEETNTVSITVIEEPVTETTELPMKVEAWQCEDGNHDIRLWEYTPPTFFEDGRTEYRCMKCDLKDITILERLNVKTAFEVTWEDHFMWNGEDIGPKIYLFEPWWCFGARFNIGEWRERGVEYRGQLWFDVQTYADRIEFYLDGEYFDTIYRTDTPTD